MIVRYDLVFTDQVLNSDMYFTRVYTNFGTTSEGAAKGSKNELLLLTAKTTGVCKTRS